MKNIKKGLLTLLLLLISVSFFYGIDLSFKFSGGQNYLRLDTINRTLQDWTKWQRENAHHNQWDIEGEPKKLHTCLDFVGEIMITLNSHFSVGLGSGIIYGELIDKKTEITVKKEGATEILAHPTKVNAYPFTFSGYFSLPLGEKFAIYLKSSIGILLAKYIHWEGMRILPEEEFEFYSSQIASAEGPLFEGGIGFIAEIDTHLRLFIESAARKARIKGFERETEEGKKGTLYFLEEHDPEIDFWQAQLQVLTEKPTGKKFRSVEEAVVDFSGFSVKIGIIIKF
ncbi:MAG: hypothetical protein ACETWK_01055 [Candidatus Aminicenantaceae bacterium]